MRLAERAPVCLLGLLVFTIPFAFTFKCEAPPPNAGRVVPPVPALNVQLRAQHGCQPAKRKPVLHCSSTSVEDVEMVAIANGKLTSACWKRTTRHQRQARAVVSTHITPDGTFTNVAVEGVTGRLQECITAVVSAWTMRAPGCETDVKFVLMLDE